LLLSLNGGAIGFEIIRTVGVTTLLLGTPWHDLPNEESAAASPPRLLELFLDPRE
jgi:hypothetical protein